MSLYTVTLRFQYPAWDEREGLCFPVEAPSKSAAISRARRQAERDGHTPSVGKGRVTFTTTEEGP